MDGICVPPKTLGQDVATSVDINLRCIKVDKSSGTADVMDVDIEEKDENFNELEELNCGILRKREIYRENHTKIKFNDTEVNLNSDNTDKDHSHTGITGGIGICVKKDAGMERHVGGIGSHVAALADNDFVKNLLDELQELLAGTEVVIKTIEPLVELPLKKSPDTLNAVEGRSYKENNSEILDAEELTVGRLELGNEAVLSEGLLDSMSVVSSMVVEN